MGSLPPNLGLGETSPRREFSEAFGGESSTEAELGLDDPGLIEEYLAGNPAAYGELVRRHQIPLFRLLLGLLADEDVAEIACEEVFLVAERRLADLEDRSTCYQWLLGIAREVSNKLNEQGAYDRTLAPETGDPRDHLKREVHAVLQQLAPDLRLVLVLVELRSAPPEDVAAALGCPLGDVPALVSEARTEFARILASRASQAPHSDAVAPPQRTVEIPELDAGAIVDGRYRITSVLAQGGMGVVYTAERVSDGLEVALKTLLPGVVQDDKSLRRFEREIEAIERVHHRGFVEVLGHGRSGEMPYLVMELLRGRPLTALVRAGEPLEPRRALTLAREVLVALGHAHEVGVVHRDLKLDNLFVLDQGEGSTADGDGPQLKVLDLGLAKLLLDDEATAPTMLTEHGMIFGTPAYMAPEQALGEEVDLRADLYAVAVILYQLLAGRLPFESASPAALLVMHVSSDPPPLELRAPHLDGTELPALLRRGLAKDREERYASAQEFIAAIGGALASPLPAPGDMSPAGAGAPEGRATTARLAAGAVDSEGREAELIGAGQAPARRGSARLVATLVGVILLAAAAIGSARLLGLV